MRVRKENEKRVTENLVEEVSKSNYYAVNDGGVVILGQMEKEHFIANEKAVKDVQVAETLEDCLPQVTALEGRNSTLSARQAKLKGVGRKAALAVEVDLDVAYGVITQALDSENAKVVSESD